MPPVTASFPRVSRKAIIFHFMLLFISSLSLVLRLSASLQGKLYDLSDNLIYWRELLAFSASLWGEQSVFRTTHILPDTYFRNLFDAFDNYANRSLIERYSGSTQSKRPQHDSMEFLTFVLDKLHEQVQSFELDVNPSSPLTSMTGGEDDGWSTVGKGGSKVVVDEQSKNIANSMATASIVTKIFQGLLRYSKWFPNGFPHFYPLMAPASSKFSDAKWIIGTKSCAVPLFRHFIA